MRLVYFARVREAIGRDGEEIDLPDEVSTVADLVDWLGKRGAGYSEAFGDRTRLRAAVDQRFVPLEAPLAGAKEVALFPPVTGG